MKTKLGNTLERERATPILNQRSAETQSFDSIVRLPNGLEEKVCRHSVKALNQILADTMVLRDLYKKSHWQVAGATFYQLHLLFDKHYDEQVKLVDELAERVQLLGGISVAMAHDVVDLTRIPRAQKGREAVPVQISRLLNAHEIILREAHEAAEQVGDQGDDGTNDLLVSSLIRINQLQVWFLAEHLVGTPVVKAE